MNTYTIYYSHDGEVYHNVWEGETLEDAILSAKYQLEDCGTGNKVLEEKTINENLYN